MNLKKILAGIAPALATAIGGPVAGVAVKALANSLLGKDTATETELAEAVLSASPEQLVAIKKMDADFRTRMAELGVDLAKLEVEDRKSARGMFSVNIWPQITLSMVFIGGYFGALVALMTGNVAIDVSMMPVFQTVVGVLTAGVVNIMAFWFGSSLGSKQKTAQLG